MHGDRDKIISSGFDGYLSKPINSALLLKELAHLLKKTDDHEAINPSR
jgi:CheY-like chemotaxis protein